MKGRAKQKQSYEKGRDHLSDIDGRGAIKEKTTGPLQVVRDRVLTQGHWYLLMIRPEKSQPRLHHLSSVSSLQIKRGMRPQVRRWKAAVNRSFVGGDARN